jgi:hypothetical protein
MKLVRLTTGEEVVCDLEQTMEGNYIIKDGVMLMALGEGRLGFMPFMAHAAGEPIEISSKFVMFVTTPQQEIIDNIRSARSGIQVPSKGGIIL